MAHVSALTDDERAELERLRTEVSRLRARDDAREGGSAPDGGGPARQRWRTIVATLLIVVGCVLAPLSVVAVWSSNQLTNTDRYVENVSPLADEPAIQDAIAGKITDEVFTYIDVEAITTQALEALGNQGLPPEVATQLQALSAPLASGIESFTRSQVDRVVQSDAFADAWVAANRVAHEQLVAALTGTGSGSITVENDTVSVNMAALIQTVKERSSTAASPWPSAFPRSTRRRPLQSQDVARAHGPST